MSDAVADFVSECQKSLDSGSFVKLTLSNYKGPEQHLQKVAARLIEVKRGRELSLQFHFDTRQTVKNHPLHEAPSMIRELIHSGFRNAHLFTTTNDFQLTIGKRSSRLQKGKARVAETPSRDHDRSKTSQIDPGAFYLKALGITSDDGSVRAQQRDKWRQINKYVEILGGLLDQSSLRDATGLKLVDMGSGKGYLTFAAYDFFTNIRGLNVEMIGVDTKQELVQLCNQVAAAAGFSGLQFVHGEIETFGVTQADVLIALHACDTATDDALFKGISAAAEIIVAAPCCHKEIRKQIKPPAALRNVLKHGTLAEREAELLTDGLRAMLLEQNGYSTKVFEFVPTQHTPKNTMIVAVRKDSGSPPLPRISAEIEELKGLYGIREQRLENLLA
jgi:SAM-dependent methyltransferase